MPALAVFFSSVFGALFSAVAQFFTRRVAVATLVIATFSAVTLAFYLAMKALVAGVVVQVGFEPFVMAFHAMWPSNAETCLTLMASARLAAFLYRYKVTLLQTIGGPG